MHLYGVGLSLFCWVTLAWAEPEPLLLSSYINNNKTAEGRNLSTVDPSQFLGVASYSGYITVDEQYKSRLFFWYFPVAKLNVSETPLIIWLQGGPGASSLLGAFLEIGPIGMNGTKDSVLFSRPTSWGVNHSLLFIDNPVGSGLSYTETNHYDSDVNICADHLYSFLQQFFTIYPESRPAPLFIAGESYGGRYVPALAKKVYDSKESHERETKINLQGLILGNPLFNFLDTANYSQIFYQWGLIDQQGVLSIKKTQDDYIAAIKNNASYAEDLHDKLLDKLQALTLHKKLYNVLDYKDLDINAFLAFIDSKKFKEDVHGALFPISTVTNHDVLNALRPDFLRNMDSTMTFLLEHYRVLIYCGQLDLVQPCVPNAEARRRKWHWSKRSEFLKAYRTPIVFAPNEVAGYVKSGGGLTEVLVVGAGHLVPIDKPKEIQTIVSYFIKAKELPSVTPGIDNTLPLPDLDIDVSNKTNSDTPTSNSTNSTDKTKSDTTTNNTISNKPLNPELVTNKSVIVTNLNIVSWILNVVLVIGVIVCCFLYWRHKRRYRDYLLNDDDSLSNGMLTMS